MHDPAGVRQVAAEAIREAALVMNNPSDLINVALEVLVSNSLELLGFTTLDAMVSQIRGEVNRELFARIDGRISPQERARLAGVLEVGGTGGISMFTRFTRPARRASWSRFTGRGSKGSRSIWSRSMSSVTRRSGLRMSLGQVGRGV
jgi:hypothetical protein